MSKDETLTIRVDRAMKERLDAVAKSLNRSRSHVAGEAIAEFVAVQEWQIARTEAAIRAIDAGEGVDHAAVVNWVNSLDSKKPLPRPSASKRRG